MVACEASSGCEEGFYESWRPVRDARGEERRLEGGRGGGGGVSYGVWRVSWRPSHPSSELKMQFVSAAVPRVEEHTLTIRSWTSTKKRYTAVRVLD